MDDIQIPPKLSRAEALAWMDEQEEKLKRVLSKLRMLRNALAPVNSLPDELLLSIFSLLSSTDAWTARPRGGSLWLSVVGTCQRWRNIAHSFPPLWSRIDFGNDVSKLRYAHHFIRLSGDVPLKVSLYRDRNRTTMDEITGILLPHLSRIENLQFTLRGSNIHQLLPVLTCSAPLLRVLCLRQDASSRSLLLERQDSVMIPRIFDSDAPLLEQLTLKHVSVNWTTSIFQGLSVLDIASENPIYTPTMESFLDVLDACPKLQALRLVDAGPELPRGTVEYPEPLRSVHLAELRRLTLSARCINVAWIAAHLEVPSSTVLRLSSDMESDAEDLSHLLPRNILKLGKSRLSV
jgi:hypothetical protein